MSKYLSVYMLYAVWLTRGTQCNRVHHQVSYVLCGQRDDIFDIRSSNIGKFESDRGHMSE